MTELTRPEKVVDKLLEADDLDWEHDPEDPDQVANLHQATDAATGDWRWRAVNELRAIFFADGHDISDIADPDLIDPPELEDQIEVKLDGDTMYFVYKNEEAAHNSAVAQVEQDLRDEPEIFNQNWLEGYINVEKLKNSLWDDYEEYNLRQRHDTDEDWRDFLIDQKLLDEEGFYDEDLNELSIEGALVDKIESAREAWIEQEKEAFDPMYYLREISGDAEAAKEAIRIAGIDAEKAAEDAVSTDGWPHFLSRSSGSYDTLPSGAVYFEA